jgi:hypothetical protein
VKLLALISLLFLSLSASTQYPNDTELKDIMDKIVSPLEANDMDSFLKHVTFPFNVGGQKYSESELRKSFNEVFLKGTISCLKDKGNYQMALPDNHSWYMAVCFSAPEGYDVSVFTFKKKNGTWMVDDLDLQKD